MSVHCGITFDQVIYSPGDEVHCTVTLTLTAARRVRDVSVRFLGETTTEFGKRRWKCLTKRLRGYQEHFRSFKDIRTNEFTLSAGTHQWRVTFQLPAALPSSFRGKYGSIVYSARLNLDKEFADREDFVREFKVVAPEEPPGEVWGPLTVENTIDTCRCGCQAASMNLISSVPQTHFLSGQAVPITIECKNVRNIHKFRLDISLWKVISYQSVLPVTEIKLEREKLAGLTLINTDHFVTKTWAGRLEIPKITVPNLSKCAIIEIRFVIEIVAKISAFSKSIRLNEIPITLVASPVVLVAGAEAKLAPIIKKMEEFEATHLLMNGNETPPLPYDDTLG